jgi:hypothetical protein
VTDADLTLILASFPQLTSLIVTSEQPITDVGARTLSAMRNLQHLDIGLWCPNLTNGGVQHISLLTNLRHLTLAVTDDGLAHIATSCSRLTTLILNGNLITDKGARSLSAMQTLECLRIRFRCSTLTTAGVQSISLLTKLRHLELYRSKAVEFGVLSALTNLEILQLGYHLSDASLATIATLPNLQELCLTDHASTQTNLSDSGLRALMALTTLTDLTLFSVDAITDANVLTLTVSTGSSNAHKLKFLTFNQCRCGEVTASLAQYSGGS